MFQKIRKNKFFRKALVFASVFLILATTLVFPVLAQAPSIDINGSSNDFSYYNIYFSEPNSSDTNSLVISSFSFSNSSDYNEYFIFYEPFFVNYGFSLTDNPDDIYDILEEDYYHNDYDTSNYLVYDGYGSTYMLYSCFNSRSSFINSWNSQFSWAIDKNYQVNSLTQQNTTLNNELAAKDEQIASLQQGIENANRQYQILSNQYDDLTNSYNTLQGENNTLQTNYNTLQSNYSTLQGDYNSLNDNYIDLQNGYNILSNNYDNLQSEYSRLKQVWAELYDDYLVAESQGYTRALNDMEAFEKGLFSIFNAPFVFVQNIVGFEIFGVSLTEILVFILILCIGYVILRFIGGALPL